MINDQEPGSYGTTSWGTADTLEAIGHPHAALHQLDQARTVWQEALQLYREQGRDDAATLVQQQLDNLE